MGPIETSCLKGKAHEVQSMPEQIGRDSGNGKFIPVKEAERRHDTATVETIKPTNPPKKGK